MKTQIYLPSGNSPKQFILDASLNISQISILREEKRKKKEKAAMSLIPK